MAGVRWEALVAIAAAALVMILRFKRMAEHRPLRRHALWVLPVILVAALFFVTIAAPPPPHGLAIMALALLIGGFVGWKRGQLIEIRRDGEGGWQQRASPMAMALLLGAIGLKFALRYVTDSPVLPDAYQKVDDTALIASNALLAFMIALVSMTRIEMALRCRRIAAGQQEEGCG